MGLADPQRTPVVASGSVLYGPGSLAFGSNRRVTEASLRVHELWARFRFSVIGQLLAAPPAHGTMRLGLEKLAVREWRHPKTLWAPVPELRR